LRCPPARIVIWAEEQQGMRVSRFSSIAGIIASVIASMLAFTATAGAQEERKLIESRESLYNNIFVFSEGPYLSMTFGYNRAIYTESVYNTKDDRDLPVPYTRFMTESLAYAKQVHSVLEIGFGGGRTAWYLHRFLPDVPVTSVELDPVIVELAHKYFGVKDEPNFRVVNQDGRLFLSNSKERYDVILIDAYRGPFVPFHLLTKEFYQIVKDHLAEGGVVAQNVEPTTMLFDSAVKTIHSVFPQVEFYLAEGNVVTIAYNGPEKTDAELESLAGARQNEFHLRYDLHKMLADRKRLPLDDSGTIDKTAKILTDDFAPVEALKAIAEHNRKWPN
jgi:spermidine synthase